MTNKEEHKHCTPEQLYLKMLEIGSECITCGTNLTKIKSELLKCGLISKNEDDKTLKILFENSFEDDYYNPKSITCKCPEPDIDHPETKEAFKTYNEQLKLSKDFDHYNNCTWFISQKALMNLLHLRESENNRVVSENSKTISTRSLCISGVSLFISILSAFVPLIYDKCYESTDTKQLKELNITVSEGLKKQETLQYQTSTLLNSIHITLNKANLLHDSLSMVSLKENMKKVSKPTNKILKNAESSNINKNK